MSTSTFTCARCGEAGSGRFCAGCGGALKNAACDACGHTAPAGARFCPQCGAGIGASGTTAVRQSATTPVARLYGGVALLVLAAFIGGNLMGRRAESGGAIAAPPGVDLASAPMQAGNPSAPDISTMSPEERANRLFNRVMQYSEQGKVDSARFFAPMAIQAYEMIGVRDAHEQYDIGVISAAVGDVTRARAEADTILAARPTHLLGLVLAAKAAELARDSAAAERFSKRLVAAAPAERVTALKEYGEHARDIDEALGKAAKR
ncbi:MAG: zinc ribbon domain-containing protein [bacterium]